MSMAHKQKAASGAKKVRKKGPALLLGLFVD
jgi:hypothetical protein